jgi:hypothetical protein
MKKGTNNEVNKEYIDAVIFYEHEIANHSPEVTPDSFINLSFLYWCFAFEFFEFATPNNIPEYWINIGGNRFLKILEIGLEKFPNNIEVHFWRRYFFHISYGEEFSEIECLDLIEKYGDKESKVLYFYLYLFDKNKYKIQKDDLIEEIKNLPTAKNLYIESILNGHLC